MNNLWTNNLLLPYFGNEKKPKKTQRVVKSNLAAEILAPQEALEACYMMRLTSLEIFMIEKKEI